MDTVQTKMLKIINQYNMLDNVDAIIIGVSGGPDSMCLLSLFNKIKINYKFILEVIHIHHGIRGKEADDDAKYVQEYCDNLNIPCKVYYYDIVKEAKKLKLTEEEAGRLYRYKAFQAEVSKYKNGKIAVAHHLNDQAETVLHHMIRGTGLKGLGGMKPKRENIIRPLITCSREEIITYCETNNINYKIDYTNSIDDYTRNKLRLKLIPYLKENFNPQIVKSLGQMSLILQEEENYINDQTLSAYDNCVVKQGETYKLDINLFKNYHKAVQMRILRKILEHTVNSLKDIHYIHIENLYSLLYKESGKNITLPKGLKVTKSYNELLFMKKDLLNDINFKYEISKIPHQYFIEECSMHLEVNIIKNNKNESYPKNCYTKWFDYDKIKNTIELRNRSAGDYIKLKLNEKVLCKKKLKDYLIDNKIPLYQRDKIPLLTDGKEIIWIIGYRINEDYKVTEKTKTILKVHWTKNICS